MVFATAFRGDLIELALATCARCPVRQPCLDDALDLELGERVTFGIRGGLLASERIELVRTRSVEVVAVRGAVAAAI